MSKHETSAADRLVQKVVGRLEDLQRAGVSHLPKPALAEVRPPAAGPDEQQQHQQVFRLGLGDGPQPSRPESREERAAALAETACRVAACVRCAELARTRTQTVFGSGNPCARLVFLGEAPGADEDRQGQPFVGRAGQLLTDMIVKGMRMRREDVYILNILKCRPPGNRTPLPTEAANCREHLDLQLAIIRPEFICCLGAVAAQNLLGVSTPIGQLRGRVLNYEGIKVLCTYHPAYLLRNPAAKRPTWEDLQVLMSAMGVPTPKK